MMTLITIISSTEFISAGFGALLGSLVTIGIAVIQGRIERAVVLHQEFCSAQMADLRNSAWKFRKSNPGKQLSDHHFTEGEDAEAAALWTIIRFYERAYVLLDQNMVSRKTATRLLGYHFIWWYNAALKDYLELDALDTDADRLYNWEVRRTIKKMNNVLKKYAGDRQFNAWADDVALELSRPHKSGAGEG
ncbi:hypothetical protein [Roseixanthobacter liquoris]|uniref:hypothetical protein n=1 Tax=Roseixanthobacter liquoris TaxID=3119921 RepID=UPI00372C8FB8